MTSPDGITWTARTPAQTNTWYGVTYGNGLFVAVSLDGANRVMTSPDGITWTARSAAEASGWRAVRYGNGLFAAIAINGTNRVMTSPDGITWTARSAAEANAWTSITYGNGLFIAVSSNGTNRIMKSTDGITWTSEASPELNTWFSITYGNGLFAATSVGGTNRIMTRSCPGFVAEEEEEEEEDEEEPEIFLPDPIAQYQLDETAGTIIYDAWNGLSGTLSGATNPTSVSGRSGKAIDFDGVDDRVSFATQSSINGLTSMTIAGWVRQDVAGVQYIYNTRNTGSNGFFVGTGAAGQLNFNAGSGGVWAVNAAIPLSTWTHFAVTYDASAFATAPVFYINGATVTATSSVAASAYTAPTGGSWVASTAAGGNYFNGSLDDIRVFDKILNPAQIELLYQNRQPNVSVAPNASAILGANKYRGTISAMLNNACMVRSDGTAACWGGEATGELGNGATAGNQTDPSRVETVTTTNNFAQISAGRGFSCGVKADGSGWCWGDDTNGELGNGATTGQQDNPSPVSGGHVFSMIAVSNYHACGLRNDGQILCWGNDTYGQLGNAGGGASSSPGVISDVGPWVYVTTGDSNTCGIKTDGSAWCWGNTNNGRNGEGTLTPTSLQTPVPISQAGPWVKLTAGFDHTCGIKLDGTAWCWGSPSYGKLGLGQVSANIGIPHMIEDVGPWIDIDTHYGNGTCGIKMDGTAWCWGDDSVYALGNGTAITADQRTPSMVTDPGPWASITAGRGFTCGIKVDGSAWCWGDDASGNLGNGPVITANQPSPDRVKFTPDRPAFTFNDTQTLMTKNAAASTISIGTTARIGYDGESGGFGFTPSGNGILNNNKGDIGLWVEAVGNYDSQITLKTGGASSVRSIGVDKATGTMEFGINNAGATNFMSAIAPQMEINEDGYLGIGTTGTPVAKLDIDGALKIGDDTRACVVSRMGVIRYASGVLSFCDGTTWTDF